MTSRIRLEPEAQAFVDAAAKPPFLFTLGPEKGRIALDEAQSGQVSKLPIDIEDLTLTTAQAARSLFASCGHCMPRRRFPSLCTSMVPGGYSAAYRRTTG